VCVYRCFRRNENRDRRRGVLAMDYRSIPSLSSFFNGATLGDCEDLASTVMQTTSELYVKFVKKNQTDDQDQVFGLCSEYFIVSFWHKLGCWKVL
jgi:hypothetical protein